MVYLKEFSKRETMSGRLLKLDKWFKSYEHLKWQKDVKYQKKLGKNEKVSNLGRQLQNLLEKNVNPGVTARNLLR